ncbi:hypothetical protein KKD52_09770 [Myxococcota bacterium]|nr:hypothetical protein [Myxococcota bacterium]MBU1510634.1 hypothetical protein [Myxococcota bacterium]
MITGKLDFLPMQFLNTLDDQLEHNDRLHMIEERGQLHFLVDGREVPVNTLYYWYREALHDGRNRRPEFLPPVRKYG